MLLNWRKARECLLIWCCSTRRRIEAYLSEVDGVLYIKTDQLDGETDWKVREIVSLTQKSVQDDPICLLDYKGYVQANPPSKEIHKFKDSFFGDNDKKEALRLKNTVWSHTVLASSEAYGLVIFVGKETRIKLNSKEPRTKIGKTDYEIDRLSQFLFAMMVTLLYALLFLSGLWNSSKWYIHGIKYVVLLSNIIPISLRVNVDFAKLLYLFRIRYDERLEGTVVRNTGIPEELGRIEYLLSDKTGTMTKNEMVFKRFTTEKGNYSAKHKEIIIEKLKSAGKESSGGKDSSEEGILKMFSQCLMLCHNVTPKKSKNKDGSRLEI